MVFHFGSIRRYLPFLFLAVCGTFFGEETQNKVPLTDPSVKAVQAIYQQVHQALEKGVYTRQAMGYTYCEPSVTYQALYRDGQHVVRFYLVSGGSDDSAETQAYFYDEQGRLRFYLFLGGAVNGTDKEVRYYFDENGKVITSRTKIKGPGYPGLVSDDFAFNPIKAFKEAPSCGELKNENEWDVPNQFDWVKPSLKGGSASSNDAVPCPGPRKIVFHMGFWISGKHDTRSKMEKTVKAVQAFADKNKIELVKDPNDNFHAYTLTCGDNLIQVDFLKSDEEFLEICKTFFGVN